MTHTPIPIVERYRQVGLHDQQDEARLAIVRAEIDAVFNMAGQIRDLVDWVANRSKAPESRLLAGALLRAEYDLATDERRLRPDVDMEWLGAVTAGLATTRSRKYYDSIYAPFPPPRGKPGDPGMPVLRATPLRD